MTCYAIRPRDPRIRPLPYPYAGALSISNDIEFTDFQFFEALMAYLNSRAETPLGRGLGLEVTSSMFFYGGKRTFSYFEGTDRHASESAEAGRIADYLRAGLIDTCHAYGDFDGVGGFERGHAERVFEVLAGLGVALDVFTNHGSTDNVQNIGTDAPYHRGDRPEHPAYHADLLGRHGVRFVWTDTEADEPWQRGTGWRAAYHAAREAARRPSALVRDVTLQDGQTMRGFRRFRGTGTFAPNLSSLGAQLDRLDWQRLYRHHAVVVYQHLGLLSRSKRQWTPSTLEAAAARPEVHLAPFRRLAREHDEGRPWVAGTARLLRFLDAVASARVSEETIDGKTVVRLSTSGTAEDLAGICVYVDPRADPVLYLDSGRTEVPVRRNGPDATGRYSVSIPMDRLEVPR